MDSTEEHVRRFLLHAGLEPVAYEPDGNQPPDFVAAGGIAVEARRLNKHHESAGKPVALDKDAFPLLSGMRKLLASFGASREDLSWFVMYQYQRPVPRWRDIAPSVRAVLESIDRTSRAPLETIHILEGFSLQLIQASGSQEERFMLGGYADFDATGWLLADLQHNIQICVDEKSTKIARVRHRYQHWWLVLVDHIGLGGSSLESELFSEHVRVTHNWNRVVLLSPSDHMRARIIDSVQPLRT